MIVSQVKIDIMYYPNSQIKQNLYTNGNEYILTTTQELYKGSFYETSSGNKYTGKTPNDGPNILLEKQDSKFPSTKDYEGTSPLIMQSSYEDNYNQTSITPRSLPPSNPTQPSSKDYESGRFVRYFAKKNNELKYMEINKETHDQLNSRQTLSYNLFS